MKKLSCLIMVAVLFLSGTMVHAQDFDSDPLINVMSKKKSVKFTIGSRMISDYAYYHSEFTPMKSGAALVDARIRTSLTYSNWYFYADFDFSRGQFHQKNLMLQNSFPTAKGTHTIRTGYYNNPIGMAKNTSIGSMHFLTRASVANALGAGRELGISYKFYNDHVFLNQGIFAENEYNNQEAGSQGLTVGGRWLYLPVNDNQMTLHLGAGFRYANLCTGSLVAGDVIKTSLSMGTNLETYTDNTSQFVSVTLPWAKHIFDVDVEALFKTADFFLRGEYMYKSVLKQRDDAALYQDAVASGAPWNSLDAWRESNPLGTNEFMGAYVEAGYKLFGNAYQYSNSDAVLKGLDGTSLEFVARYSYVGLNDIVEGGQPAPLSADGGNLHSATLGVNYAFNRFAQVMVHYTYNHLDREKYLHDHNFHSAQVRMLFQF